MARTASILWIALADEAGDERKARGLRPSEVRNILPVIASTVFTMDLRPSKEYFYDAKSEWHVFRSIPTMVFYVGVFFLALSVASIVVGILEWMGAADRGAGHSPFLWFFAFGLCSAWFGFRSFRVGVYVRPGVLRVNNWFRTRTVERSEIAAINVEITKEGEAGRVWRPTVELNDGSIVRISAIDCGRVDAHKDHVTWPTIESTELVAKIRKILNVGGF